MQHNFRAWVNGFAPLVVGADLDSPAVVEFSRTFFNIRPDIALSITKSIFQSDMRRIIPQVITLQRHLSLPTLRMCDVSKIQCTWSGLLCAPQEPVGCRHLTRVCTSGYPCR